VTAISISGHDAQLDDVYANDPAIQQLLADAHATSDKPLCHCTTSGIELVVRKLSSGRYTIAKHPLDTRHHRTCRWYASPLETSPAAIYTNSAYTIDNDGRCTITLAPKPARGPLPSTRPTNHHASHHDQRRAHVSLRALLEVLWSDTRLNTWWPAMATKRTWPLVSALLQRSASNITLRNTSTLLANDLFTPPPWSKDRAAQHHEHVNQWWSTHDTGFIIGEVATWTPRPPGGARLTVKHLPQHPIWLDPATANQLDMFSASDDTSQPLLWRNVVIATCRQSRSGSFTADNAAVMATNRNWVPVNSHDELVVSVQLSQRGHIKPARYDTAANVDVPAFVIIDDARGDIALHLAAQRDAPSTSNAARSDLELQPQVHHSSNKPCWSWHVDPNNIGLALPPRQQRRGDDRGFGQAQ
jgi:hypothetical protein